jgi:hypothetical protein
VAIWSDWELRFQRFIHYASIVGAVCIVIAFVFLLWRSPSSTERKNRQRIRQLPSSTENERDRIFDILKKSDAALTDHERNQLILLGFGKDDNELTGAEQFRLEMYGLVEARRSWREHHKPLPKDFITPADSSSNERRPRL